MPASSITFVPQPGNDLCDAANDRHRPGARVLPSRDKLAAESPCTLISLGGKGGAGVRVALRFQVGPARPARGRPLR